jgi:hypothetical protein
MDDEEKVMKKREVDRALCSRCTKKTRSLNVKETTPGEIKIGETLSVLFKLTITW